MAEESARLGLRLFSRCCTLAILLASACTCVTLAPYPAQDMVRRSVDNTNADWAAAPRYSFTERDAVTKNGKRSVKTYEVLMIDGSPYDKLIAANDEKLAAAAAADEESKLRQEIEKRRRETSRERGRRISKYLKERGQDHELMSEMVNAFDFQLVGEEMVNGRNCFVLTATPRNNYQPRSRETKVLKGMRGRMWIDADRFQWVKVNAEVFRPVAFGLFIAHLYPGTEFTLEQAPVEGNMWLPSLFSMSVRARILFASRNSYDDEKYSNYRLNPTAPDH